MSDFQLQEKFIDTAQGRICYYSNQNFASRPTVVFLHGLSSNHTTWVNVMTKLYLAGYNALALDMRGHGHSDKSKRYGNYELTVFSEDLKQILDQEQLEKIVLVGYSFGGSVSLEFISHYPDRVLGLILISANSVCPLKYWHLILLKYPLWLVYNLMGFLLLWQRRKQDIYFQQGMSRGFWHSFWIGLNTMPLSINFWMFVRAATIDFRKILPEINIPVILMRAKHDPYLTLREAENMQKMIRNSRLIISDNQNHFLAAHAQNEILQMILDFLPTL